MSQTATPERPATSSRVAAATALSTQACCRFCGAPLKHRFVDLGMSPLCQTHIEPHQLNHMEPFYPLCAWVCDQCFLVQLEEYVAPSDIFSDYAYFSSYSDSWVEHARRYTEQMISRFGFGAQSRVMEIASNDGYLLQHFVRAGVPCRGIEPAANVAEVAVGKGIPTSVCFFGRETARAIAGEHGQASLLLGNNVLAHVPDINDFVGGMKILLAPVGVITMEFPHLQQLMEQNQFDTIYHEHFSYLSFTTVERIFAHHGLTLFDVEELPTHGGSLRIYGRHSDDASKPVGERVTALRERERAKGYTRLETYADFAERVRETKRKLLAFLIEAKRAGKTIAGYGAPGKGNTLLNYCGIRQDFLDYTVDRNPHKYGRFTPGTHIPILHPDAIRETRPDYLLLLPWNLKDEIMQQTAYIREWGGKFVIPIPEVTVL
ncbi:class I SAM-dependent methyltransferase [Hydrogenophaga sp.]|uniref:class I SAM-dependent methyltransferase n=1 Tax=Hydrogenophaga sp. TaxID=1904254 RepID=UPI0026366226|nr:class I SAM-dependent methyltransferase [Hydrogenophaga sp.]MCW5652278.1 methyltransferase domain-containing protein [Hydrogenophaga sp.]